MKQLMIDEAIPVYTRDIKYPKDLTKKSTRCRKKAGILEYGNASVVFQLEKTNQLWKDLTFWWDYEYQKEGLRFNVELYEDLEEGLIEIRYMLSSPYYTRRKPAKNTPESVLNDIEGNVLSCYEKLPSCFTGLIEMCYVSDWDYLEYAEDEEEI